MKDDYVELLVSEYARVGALVDTNLLLLYFIGNFDPGKIGSKRLKEFAYSDFVILRNLLGVFSNLVTTPHVLSEVSNFVEQVVSKDQLQNAFSSFAYTTLSLDEQAIPIENIRESTAFLKHGVADAGIVDLARSTYLVLTDDFPLANRLQSMGSAAINFNNLRVAYGN